MKKQPNQKRIFADEIAKPDIWIDIYSQLAAAASLIESETQSRWRILMDQMFHGATRDPMQLEAANFQSVHLMLSAFAVENLLKAAIVQTHRERIIRNATKTGMLPRMLKTHDLVKLCKHASISISSGEESLLRRMTKNSTWFGRYPVPVSSRQLFGGNNPTGSKYILETFWSKSDVESVHKLVQSLEEQTRLSRTKI